MHFNAICSTKNVGTNTTCQLNWIQENREVKVVGLLKESGLYTVTIEKDATGLFGGDSELNDVKNLKELISLFLP